MPELKQIVGSLVFGAVRPLPVRALRQCIREVAEAEGGDVAAFASVRESDVEDAVQQLADELARARCGFSLVEVAGGVRLQSDPACGRWVRHLLNADKPNRLSRPALETLAIIAYRQPVTRTDVEAIRGVNVDHMVRLLLEAQLVRIVGRSELPGRPFLYGTTQAFLEHFGLKSLKDLGDMEPLLALRDAGEPAKAKPPAVAPTAGAPEGGTAGTEEPPAPAVPEAPRVAAEPGPAGSAAAPAQGAGDARDPEP
jgi:segregation and condensation protein B